MEILAPAGSILALKAAIKGGANAVYLGLGEHNARIKSSDFTMDNLREWVSYAHLFSVKVYLTLNTAVKDQEIDRVLKLAETAVHAGVDALIVSDLGLVKLLSERTDVPLHLSTQAGVQNPLDAKGLRALGIKRVILSREAVKEDIKKIKEYVDEVEVFAQGALCVSFSGGCLMGSKVYGLSGNRGVCNQACRLTYTASDPSGKVLRSGKLLSPADLSLGKEVLKLSELGVDSIKIEGRLKRPAYVFAATNYYRTILAGKNADQALADLSESFNRGYTKGYTLCKSDPIIHPNTSSHLGVSVGKVQSVFVRNGYKFAKISSTYDFVKGDGAKILRNGKEVGGSDVTSVRKESNLTVIPVSDGVKSGDEVRLTTNVRKVVDAETITNKLPITICVKGAVGTPLSLIAECCNVRVEVQSDSLAERARVEDNSAMFDKLTKIGNTDFVLDKILDQTEEPLYIALSELNALRRTLLENLRTKLITLHTPNYRFATVSEFFETKDQRPVLKILELSDPHDVSVFSQADGYVLSLDRLDEKSLKNISLKEKPIYLRVPKILRGRELPRITDFLSAFPGLGIYADNLYAVNLARDLHRSFIVGFGMNVFNRATRSLFDDADLVCSSIEHSDAGDLVYVCGKVPLMSFAHCPFSVVYGTHCKDCKKEYDKLIYSNKEGRFLILRREFASCDFTLYEDKNTTYPVYDRKKSRFYSLIGLNPEDKRAMMIRISEE